MQRKGAAEQRNDEEKDEVKGKERVCLLLYRTSPNKSSNTTRSRRPSSLLKSVIKAKTTFFFILTVRQ